MKKFICTAPYQTIKAYPYQSEGNDRLTYEGETGYPVICLLNGYLEPGDEAEVLVITADYENARMNYAQIEAEVEEIARKKEARCTVKMLEVPYSEKLDDQLAAFGKLIEDIHDDDILYACITYGSKPTPLIEMMALNYGYRVQKNVSIGCVVYGQLDFMTKEARIYDVTSLFYMDEIVRTLAESGAKNPLGLIQKLLEG